MARKETTSVMSKDDLNNTLAELAVTANSGLTNPSGRESVAGSSVVASPILMPTPQALQAGIDTATVNLADKHSDLVGKSSLSGTIEQLQAAVGHNQIIRSAPTNVNNSGSTMVMPSGVRDIPNRLYWYVGQDRQTHYVREKGDKLLSALFGGTVNYTEPHAPVTTGLAGTIAIMASSRGFHRDPMVWVSQVLWENLNYDYSHDFENMECEAYDNFLDSGTDSPILHALRQCFDYKDVQDLSKLAKFNNKSVLGILRKIFMNEAIKRKASIQ